MTIWRWLKRNLSPRYRRMRWLISRYLRSRRSFRRRRKPWRLRSMIFKKGSTSLIKTLERRRMSARSSGKSSPWWRNRVRLWVRMHRSWRPNILKISRSGRNFVTGSIRRWKSTSSSTHQSFQSTRSSETMSSTRATASLMSSTPLTLKESNSTSQSPQLSRLKISRL